MVRQKEGEPCCVCPCPCEGLVDVIGKKWVLCALAQLGNEGTLRFNRLAEKLPGISAKTLSDVLKDLQRNGLVKRVAYQEIPPRVEYFLTREGRELTMLVAPLMVWADRKTGLIQLDAWATYENEMRQVPEFVALVAEPLFCARKHARGP